MLSIIGPLLAFTAILATFGAAGLLAWHMAEWLTDLAANRR